MTANSEKSRVIQGDCIASMKSLADNSVDLVCTDPPYGYSFMGKDWDRAVPSVDTWREALRVLKPGAFAMVMSAPRQDVLSQMIVRIGEAGFDTEFTSIYWTYACLSADTEVLTPDGWKNHAQLRQSNFTDKLVVYDRASDSFNIEQASHWSEYAVSEDLYRIKSENTDQLVSRNHRVLTPSGFVFAESLPQHCEVVCVRTLPDSLWHIPGANTLSSRNSGDLLLNKLSPDGEGAGVERVREEQTRPYTSPSRSVARGLDGQQEHGVEGGRNDLQEEGKLQGRTVREVPVGIYGDGPEGRVRDGAPVVCGARNGPGADESGDRASRGPRSDEQCAMEFDVVRNEQGPQAVRTWASDHASVEREHYSGVIYCPTVSTGCFLARRNGKMFLTGNSGFPKAGNIGKLVDKRGGQDLTWFIDYAIASAEEQGKTKRDLQMLFPSKNDKPTGWLWNKRYTQSITLEQYNVIKDFLGLPFATLQEAEREVVGKNPNGFGRNNGHSLTHKLEAHPDLTAPATKQAKALDGSYAGFQPKPAVEIIIIAMKPLSEKTYVDQALKNGKGVTWLDACRVPTDAPYNIGNYQSHGPEGCTSLRDGSHSGDVREGRMESAGRFPANLLVSDDVLNDGRDRVGSHSQKFEGKAGSVFGCSANNIGSVVGHGDSGSYSRFFSLDAWAKTFPWLTKDISKCADNAKLNRVQIAEKKSLTTAVTTSYYPTGSVQDHAQPSSGSEKTSLAASLVGNPHDCNGTNTVPKLAQAKPAMETSGVTPPISASGSITSTTPNKPIQSRHVPVSYVDAALENLSDTIQTWRSQLKSYGSVNPAITERMQQVISRVPQWLNFDSLPSGVRNTFPFLVCAKASKSEKDKGLEAFAQQRIVSMATANGTSGEPSSITEGRDTARANSHPTVKPLTLMSYLVTLGSRPGDVVLDPFMGSGTTCIAAKMLGRTYIGMEMDEGYIKIAEARLAAHEAPAAPIPTMLTAPPPTVLTAVAIPPVARASRNRKP